MPDPAASPVSIRGLSCGYGDRTALRQLDLELPQDRTVCLMGPGGAGKSTLLRILAGRKPACDDFWQEATLLHQGLSSTRYLEQRLVGESRSLLDLLRDWGLGKERAEKAALEVWREIPAARQLMLSVLDLPLRRLPVAMSRLVAFTAVAADLPDLLLLDEPDAEMDDELRSWVQEILLRIRRRCTVVLTTHHLRLARMVSDECILIDSGRLVERGPTQEFFEQPQKERTLRFVRMGN